MVEFKSWKDTYLFILEFGRFSCLNCKYGGHNLDLDADNSDINYTHHFCSKWISMVDFNFQFVCEKWTNEDGETLVGKEDECAFNLPDKVIEKLVNEDKKWSIEEIRGLVNGC